MYPRWAASDGRRAYEPGRGRELPFMMVQPNGTAYDGIIDASAPSPDGYAIVDVKTSRCSAKETAEKAAG